MKIGITGYQGSGKSSLFHWLTGVPPDLSLAHTVQVASVEVPDDRIRQLSEIYQPKKVTLASLNLVDTPGLSRDHEGSAGKLALIREAGCLAIVVGAWSGADVQKDVQSFEEDLLLADMDLVSGRIEKLRESVKRPRPNRDKELAELDVLEPLLQELESGKPLHEINLNDEQSRTIRSFQLLTLKPRIIIVNTSDDEPPSREPVPGHSSAVWRFPVSLQLELAGMEAAERDEFCEEMGVAAIDRGAVLRALMDASRQMLFFTAGDKEVRSWMVPCGATAEDAAGSIHTDLARGFVRAERMTCEDLFRVGSEREIKARNLMTREPRGYVVQDGDILHILAST
jgi:ribosome-binding ATPase YchF (GTP1/OBG family)